MLSFGLLPGWKLVDPGSRAGDPRLRELARLVRGAVLTSASAAYERARLVYNQRFDRVRPLALVVCESAEDVRQTVLWARRHKVPLAARSGGHSYAGYSTTRGVVIDLSRLRKVRVEPARRRARIGAGARLIDVYAELARFGATIPGGSCATVGIAGLALGGGIGFSSRKLGTTSDNLRALRIVTADGRRLSCDRRSHSDLF